MKIQFTYLSSFSNRLIQCLSIVMLVWFSGTILLNSLSFYFQNDNSLQYEYCDFTSPEAEPISDQESQKEEVKENYEQFTADKKHSYSILLEKKNKLYFAKIIFFKGRVCEMLTPPPKLPFLTSQA